MLAILSAYLFLSLGAPTILRSRGCVSAGDTQDVHDRAVNTTEWFLGRQGSYHWLSMRTILINRGCELRPLTVTKLEDGSLHTTGGEAYGGDLCIVAVPSGRTHMLSKLSSIFRREQGRPASISVSFDGKTMLWRGNKGLYVSALKNGRTSVIMPGWHTMFWLKGGGLGEVLDDNSNTTNTLRICRSGDVRHEARNMRLQLPRIAVSDILGFTNSLSIVYRYHHIGEQQTIDMFVRSLCSKRSLTKSHMFRFAPDVIVERTELSPNCKRILWVLAPHYGQAVESDMKRAEIWISGTNGAQMHQIGHWPVTSLDEFARQAKWLPDSKSFSGIFQPGLLAVTRVQIPLQSAQPIQTKN